MPRRILDLNGDQWRLGQAPPDADPHTATWSELEQVQEWLPAKVPGNVRGALIQAGGLPALEYGWAPEDAQWVDRHCWWLVRDFAMSDPCGAQAHLVLRGVDYVSDIFLNGQPLGRHEGMFSPQIFEVSQFMSASNRLAVRILGSQWLPTYRSTGLEKLLNRLEARLGSAPSRFPHRRDTLKCQMGFGWDFAPPLRTMGIWDDAYLVLSDHVYIQQVAIKQQVATGVATLAVQVDLVAGVPRTVQLRCTAEVESSSDHSLETRQPVHLTSGTNHIELELAVPQPQLWWPWDHGHPSLYRLSVEVREAGAILDSIEEQVGLRSVEMSGWTLKVNGEPVYARGANWVPAHLLPGCVTREDYRDLLTLARQANMNMLRVWGGGLREKRAFYDLCDQMGILVWQEFPFSCALLTRYPRSPDYLRLAEAEVKAIVYDLCNHPCVALWCGGNELNPRRNVPLISVLQRTVAAADSSRPFLRASPGEGDSHNWQVWHHFHPPAAYLRDETSFASEFGLQAPPDAETLRRFIPAEDLWPPGPSWAYHGAELDKLRRYAAPFVTQRHPSLEEFIRASQRAQAYGLQIGVEHYRRRKAHGCGGVLIWQFNEPWPAISWALLDFYRQPKPALEAVKRLYNPVLISIKFEPRRFRASDRFSGQIWIINDLAKTLGGCQVEAMLLDGDGRIVCRFVRVVDAPAHSAASVGSLDCELPVGEAWSLSGRITQNGQVLASNAYDLSACDPIQPPPARRLRNWLVGRITRP